MAKRGGGQRQRGDTLEQLRVFTTAGAEDAERWLHARELPRPPHWHVELVLPSSDATWFELSIYAEEWGFAFHHDGKSSWVRITDIAFVHGRDDFSLFGRTPALEAIGTLIAELEAEHAIAFHRDAATIRTNVPGAPEATRAWLSGDAS